MGRLMIRLFFTGMLMGMADLVPGISGGTVAFLAGIYDRFLEALKSLKFSSLKGVHWSFLIPLGGGIFTSLLVFARLLSYLLNHHQVGLFAFLFGVITAACLSSFKRLEKKRPSWLFIGFGLSFLLASFHGALDVHFPFVWLIIAGALASMAMLLPGISGCYVLHLLGVYPIILFALSTPFEKNSLIILGLIAIGIAIGVFIFSRLIVSLLQNFNSQSLSFLVGLMVGGMRTLWSFHSSTLVFSLPFAVAGFILLYLIDLTVKKAMV